LALNNFFDEHLWLIFGIITLSNNSMVFGIINSFDPSGNKLLFTFHQLCFFFLMLLNFDL
jgi:hypothetical protein